MVVEMDPVAGLDEASTVLLLCVSDAEVESEEEEQLGDVGSR